MWPLCCVLVLYFRLKWWFFEVCNHISEEERASCFTLTVFLMSSPTRPMGWCFNTCRERFASGVSLCTCNVCSSLSINLADIFDFTLNRNSSELTRCLVVFLRFFRFDMTSNMAARKPSWKSDVELYLTLKQPCLWLQKLFRNVYSVVLLRTCDFWFVLSTNKVAGGHLYLRRLSESRSSSGFTPSVRLSIRPSVRSFVRPYVCPQHFWGA